MSGFKEKLKALWGPATYEVQDVRAMRTLVEYARYAGIVSPEGSEPVPPSPADVKRVLDWIIYKAALFDDNGFCPDDEGGRIAAFVDGRQFVGQEIRKLMLLKPEAVKK